MRPPLTQPEFVTRRMSDGYEIRGRLWRGDPESGTGVIYLHGIQSHGGWYAWSASLLAESGLSVLLPDRRGSGLNNADRGDTPSMLRWLTDLDDLADWLRASLGVSRPALVGVSWGGKLAAYWAWLNADRVSRLLLIAPGLFPKVSVGIATRAVIGLSALYSPRRQFDLPLGDGDLFTQNQTGQEFINNDRLGLRQATARFLYHSFVLDRRALRIPGKALTMPITVALAGNDRIIRNHPTQRWIERICSTSVGIQVFPDAEHTLEFESDVRPLQGFLTHWSKDVVS